MPDIGDDSMSESETKRPRLANDNIDENTNINNDNSTAPVINSLDPSINVPTIESFSSIPVPDWDYNDRIILAPMVRLNTLPFRLLCRSYGCSMLYSEELIANKIKLCERRINKEKNLIEFIQTKNNEGKLISSQINQQQPVFVTYSNEPVVFQMGANNAVTALEAALVVANDVRAIDLNMGCPERFSVEGGMGSALLKQPELAADILSTLRRNLPSSLPITCKIRILENDRDTIELMKRLEMSGIAAIAIHARYVPDRPARVRAMKEKMKLLIENVNIPCIYNGDIFYPDDINKTKELTGISNLMIARGAMWNATIFQLNDKNLLPVYNVANSYLNIASHYQHTFTNTKYCLMEMIKIHVSQTSAFKLISQAKSFVNLYQSFQQLKFELNELVNNNNVLVNSSSTKRELYQRFIAGPYTSPIINWEIRPNLPTIDFIPTT